MGLTQDIKMTFCVFQCDVPHQWIEQRQVGPVFVYYDRTGCHVLCLQCCIPVWQHNDEDRVGLAQSVACPPLAR